MLECFLFFLLQIFHLSKINKKNKVILIKNTNISMSGVDFMIDIVRKLERKEHEDKMEKMELVAQMLKKQRKKYKLTLTKASAGICSVSYLSKIENNLLENIEEKYILKLCDRMNLNYNDISSFDEVCSMETLAFSILNRAYDKIEDYYNSLNKEISNVKSDIVKGYYYLINDDYQKLNEIIGTIYEVSSTLSSSEYFMFIILVQEYYIRQYKMNKALESFKELCKIGCRFKPIEYLIIYQGLRIYFHTNDYMNFLKFYYKIVKTDDLLLPYELEIIAKIMKSSLEVLQGGDTDLDSLNLCTHTSNKQYDEEIKYYQMLLLYNLKKYDQVKKLIDNYNISNEGFKVLYNLASFSSNTFKVKERRSAYESYHKIFDSFLADYFLATSSNISKKETLYILKEYRKYEDEYSHHLYDSFIFRVFCDIYTSTTYYKEAMGYLKKNIKMVN